MHGRSQTSRLKCPCFYKRGREDPETRQRAAFRGGMHAALHKDLSVGQVGPDARRLRRMREAVHGRNRCSRSGETLRPYPRGRTDD